jgi:hypothetical protein
VALALVDAHGNTRLPGNGLTVFHGNVVAPR